MRPSALALAGFGLLLAGCSTPPTAQQCADVAMAGIVASATAASEAPADADAVRAAATAATDACQAAAAK
jgi:hypothetical protein